MKRFLLILVLVSIPAVAFAQGPYELWVSRPDVAKGVVQGYTLESKLYGTRKVWIYTPPSYEAGRTMPFDVAYVFDGEDYINEILLPVVLDNLIAQRQISATVAILVDNATDRHGDLDNHSKLRSSWRRRSYPGRARMRTSPLIRNEL